QLRRDLAAHRLAVLDPDLALRALGQVDVQAQHRAAGRGQVLHAQQLQPQRPDGRGEQRRDFVRLRVHAWSGAIPGKQKGAARAPFQSPALVRWISAYPRSNAGTDPSLRKRKRLRGALDVSDKLVAGAGFEPATFGL